MKSKQVWDIVKSRVSANLLDIEGPDWDAFVAKVDSVFKSEKSVPQYKLFTDGAARGNPGPAGAGMVIQDEKNNIIKEHFEYLGDQTNNAAEYMALSKGLDLAFAQGVKKLAIFTDSELMTKQLKGIYKVKNKVLIGLYMQVKNQLNDFDSIEINHVTRDKNKIADKLANMAIDVNK